MRVPLPGTASGRKGRRGGSLLAAWRDLRVDRIQWYLALTLLLALTVCLAGRQVASTLNDQELARKQASQVEQAVSYIQSDFADRQDELLAISRRVARDHEVRGALDLLALDSQAGVDRLVTVLAGMTFPELVSVEVYDTTPRIRGWNGFAMPLDAAPEDPRFLSTHQVDVAVDGDLRAALVAWQPVVSTGKVVGVVRTMNLLRVRVPVRNEYLSDVSVAEDWGLKTGLSVSVAYGGVLEGDQVRLTDDTGRSLLGVTVLAPSRAELVAAIRERYDDLAAFFALLLLALAAWMGIARVRRASPSALVSAATSLVILGGVRVALLLFRIPARWQEAKAPLAPLFDPSHLASTVGWGLFSTSGDLLITSLFAILAAGLVARTPPRARRWTAPGLQPLWAGVFFGVASGGLFVLVIRATRALLLDSTLDYFARSGLLPERLVALVFASLLLLLLAAALLAHTLGTRILPERKAGVWAVGLGAALASVVLAAVLGLLVPSLALSEQAALVGFAVCTWVSSSRKGNTQAAPLSVFYLRSVLLALVVLSLLLYPILDRGIELKERLRMEDASQAFREERDPRALLAIGQVIRSVQSDINQADVQRPARMDSLLEVVLRESLLSSLGTYEVSVAVLDSSGQQLGRNSASRTAAALARALQQDRADLELLLAIRQERDQTGPVIEKITSPVELDRFDYLGLDALQSRSGQGHAGSLWILVRASQHEHLPSGNTPFPRVLVPAGYYGSLYPDLSIAEFRDEVLVRSFGSAFGRSFLDPETSTLLEGRESVWTRDAIRDRTYVTYYVRNRDAMAWQRAEPSLGRSVIAVRRPAVNLFDRLYYLLRLTVSGLLLALPVYVFGIVFRWRKGELPARRIRFRDKVLNAFFAVGLVAVLAMGWVGLRVVTGETDRALESWLRQHLDRVEDALALRAGPDDMPYRVLERTDVDSLAAQVGLDLNIYRGVELESTSRPQLVRDRLISKRIPIQAYSALFISGFRFASVQESLGRFQYTAGYRALPDEQGVPRYIVSVPTLPEQERIEEERARTAAYLFGALLLLMIVVMVTAAVIANALARPVARLQKGLQTVAEGRFERIGPVDSRDEIAALVGTFNDMQDQLAESRRLVAQQERQLAWREMARQVAHEIKNPLTPMKLSVQHLRRAFSADPEGSRFRELFRSRTTTLIEQIDALARIANEFSSFARMPLQKLERLDLNEVIREAVALMQEHAHVDIQAELFTDALPVEADREALRRMYINFIKNALEALDPDRPGKVRVVSSREVDRETGNVWAVSAVVDNGTGIPAELQDRVFNPSFSTKTSGTGLGLAIARNTVEELRGRIGFETELGQGTTIWVRIPLMLTEGGLD